MLKTDERHENIVGYTHGGVLSAMADTAIGLAHLTTLQEGETATTVEIKVNYLRPVWHDQLRAHGRMIKRGKLLSLLECHIHDGENRLVVHASGTMMTLREENMREETASALKSRIPICPVKAPPSPLIPNSQTIYCACLAVLRRAHLARIRGR